MLRPEPRRWRTPLGRWVSGYGVSRLAADLSRHGQPVTPQAVYHWLSGRHAPRPGYAAVIVELSQRSVTLADVYAQREVSSGARDRA